MKGLIVIPAYFPDIKRGGGITGCRSFAKSVSKLHDIEICTLDTTNEGARVSKIDNIKVFYFKINKGLEWLSKSGWGFSLPCSIWFLKNYKNYNYIYLSSLWNYLSLFAAIVCILNGKKYTIFSSGKFSEHALKTSLLKKLILSPIVYIILRKAIFIHYCSQNEYHKTPIFIRKLTKSFISNTSVELLCEADCKKNKKPKNKRNLIYTVSRFNEIKRIEILSKIINKIDSDVDLIHIGDYKENPKYFKKIISYYQSQKIYYNFKNFTKNEKGLRIFFPGYLSIEKVNELIKNYNKTVFIQMSYSEGQSNSILEAMARGSLCLVSEGCHMDNANNKKALKITNEKNLANDIHRLFNEKNLQKSIKENQIIYLKENHSSKKIAKEFDNAISQFL